MSDVFISYARSNAKQAQAVAEALRGLGYSVWRDDELPAHRAYADVIEERLQMAKAVVVVWSAEAVRSEWVQSEADTARTDHKLVQLSVDGSKLPRPFDRIQCADLAGWTGDLNAPGWRKVVASIAELTGATVGSASERPDVVSASAQPREPLLAVLAFENMSGDPDTAYFSDGVSEEIQQTVAHGADVKVIARASSFQFRGADKAVRHVAAELKATHILDGSVRRSGPKVRISAQLVECASEVTLWSDRFDRDLSDIFALQDEIAAAVAAALKLAFAPTAQPRSIDPEAYALFLKARELAAKGRGGDAGAITLLEDVVAMAQSFARAWAHLSFCRALQLRSGQSERPYGLARTGVVEAAETALKLDPGSGIAHLALAWLEPFGDYRTREALGLKALAASPNDPVVLTWVGQLYSVVGRRREGKAYIDRAYKLDPLYDRAVFLHASFMQGVERLEAYDSACARWPDVPSIMVTALNWAALAGDWTRFDAWTASTRETGLDRLAGIREVIAYGRRLRDPDPAAHQRLLSRLQAEIAATGTVRLNALLVLHSFGLFDEVFDLVHQASFAHMFDPQGPLPAADYAPSIIFDLKDDIRFVGLCAKLGLCDYWVKTGRWPDCAEEVAYDFKAECRRLAGDSA